MKESCVMRPSNDPLIIVKKWQIEFTRQDYCAAALISYFTYYHDTKLSMTRQNKAMNDIAENHGDERAQDESLLQYHTLKQLHEGLLGLFCEKKISQAINVLKDLNVITTHRNPNPRYKFDRTTYFLFHPNVCNEWIKQRYVIDNFDNANMRDRSNQFALSNETEIPNGEGKNALSKRVNLPNGDRKNTSPIAKNTAKITTEKTAADHKSLQANPQEPSAAAFISQEDSTIIGESLTDYQQKRIEQTAKACLAFLPNYKLQNLLSEMHYVLLTPACFSNAGNDFIKKLNTVKKCIIQGKWTPPAMLRQQIKEAKQQENQTLELSLNAAKYDYEQMCLLLELGQKRGAPSNEISAMQAVCEISLQHCQSLLRKKSQQDEPRLSEG
ncbi:MAG: hypothetical protein KIT27_08340 [Legionellales bacterium]|nr:hypothetical protein [Legionellales bacterium]